MSVHVKDLIALFEIERQLIVDITFNVPAIIPNALENATNK